MPPCVIDDVLCPAKLNLFLHITGRRPDGYHLLQSVFVAIDWYDTMHFERRNDGQIIRHDLGTKLPEQDLITRAATLLQKTSQTSYGAEISIVKNIPMQAGLGGGSSNAASTLLILNHLWGLHLNAQQLHQLAKKLGSDVPFFIQKFPSWVEGIGEQLTPIKLPPYTFTIPIAVLKPELGVSTQEIFSSPLLTRSTRPHRITDFTSCELSSKEFDADSSKKSSLYAAFDFGHNDLQEAAIANQKQIAQAIKWTEVFCSGSVKMTGSGSAVFGAIRKHIDTQKESTNFLPHGWQLKLCKMLDTHPLVKWIPI